MVEETAVQKEFREIVKLLDAHFKARGKLLESRYNQIKRTASLMAGTYFE